MKHRTHNTLTNLKKVANDAQQDNNYVTDIFFNQSNQIIKQIFMTQWATEFGEA